MLLIHRHANSCKDGLQLCIAVQCIQKGFLLRDFSVSHALVGTWEKKNSQCTEQSYLPTVHKKTRF